jgi:hypothetical protein
VTGVTGCDGFPLNYLMRAHIRDFPTDPSHPSELLKRKGKTRHSVPVKPVTNPSPFPTRSAAMPNEDERPQWQHRIDRSLLAAAGSARPFTVEGVFDTVCIPSWAPYRSVPPNRAAGPL